MYAGCSEVTCPRTGYPPRWGGRCRRNGRVSGACGRSASCPRPWFNRLSALPHFTLLLQKPRMPQIQGVQGRSRSILLRAFGNEGDGTSSAFPPGKKHDKFFICFRSHQKFIREPCLNVFKCPVIILFFYTLSCFLCNFRVYALANESMDSLCFGQR